MDFKRRLNFSGQVACICAVLIVLSLLDFVEPGARYIKYLIFPICVLFCLSKASFRFNFDAYMRPFYFYIVVSALYFIVWLVGFNGSDFSDLYFVLTYMLPFMLFKYEGVSADRLFSGFSVVFGIFVLMRLGVGGFDVLASESPFEHSEFGFIFAFFVIYFLGVRNFKLALFSFLLCMLSFKRIAIAGVCIAVLVMYTRHLWYRGEWVIPLVAACLNIVVIISYGLLITDDFSDVVFDLLGISSNQLLMGRVTIYSYIFSNADIAFLHGSGPGSVYYFASKAMGVVDKFLLHSDSLKFAFEFGYVFVFVFFGLLYRLSRDYVQYVVLLNVFMLTDNVFTYASVMFVFFFLICKSPNLMATPLRWRKL